MADMGELFGSSDEESESVKANSEQNAVSDDENAASDNEDAGSAGAGNSESDNENENAVSEEADSGNENRENSEQESNDEEKQSVNGDSDAGGNSDHQNESEKSDNENEVGSNNAGSDNENAESEAGSDNERGNAAGESDNEEHEENKSNNAASEEENEKSDSDNEPEKAEDSDQEMPEEHSENENQNASGAESEREEAAAASDAGENEHSERGERSDDDAGSQHPQSDDEAAAPTASDAEGKTLTHGSDNENDEAQDEDSREPEKMDTAENLFGDADDISSGSDEEGKTAGENENDEQQNDNARDDEEGSAKGSPAPMQHEEENDDEQEEQPVEIPETRIDVEIPKIGTDLGKEIHFVKLPNFISVETRPFDHQTYEDEIDEDEVLDEEGRARLKLKVENTVRWRWGFDADGNPIKESNARIVKWSDGSMSLHLGSEIFDVHKQLLQGDHNHLFIRQGTGLQGQAVFRTKLTFRPHSTDSFTHRKITMSVADRSQKTQKIRILPNVGKDPEAHRSEMIKKEEDKLKASIRRESKQRRMKERALTRGLNSSYLESDRYDDDDEQDDDGAVSLAAIKNKFKKGARENRPPIYSSDSDASDIDDRRARRLEKAKALSDSEDDSGEDVAPKRKRMKGIEESEEED